MAICGAGPHSTLSEICFEQRSRILVSHKKAIESQCRWGQSFGSTGHSRWDIHSFLKDENIETAAIAYPNCRGLNDPTLLPFISQNLLRAVLTPQMFGQFSHLDPRD